MRERRFAGPVGTHDRVDLAEINVEVQTSQNLAITHTGPETPDLKQRHTNLFDCSGPSKMSAASKIFDDGGHAGQKLK